MLTRQVDPIGVVRSGCLANVRRDLDPVMVICRAEVLDLNVLHRRIFESDAGEFDHAGIGDDDFLRPGAAAGPPRFAWPSTMPEPLISILVRLLPLMKLVEELGHVPLASICNSPLICMLTLLFKVSGR